MKALMNVLNDIATKKGLPTLHFNGYIISVLVIFYLQLKHNFPTINGLQSKLSNDTTLLTEQKLDEIIVDFFKFYGKTYEPTHLISVNVGRWQEKRLQETQKNFTAEQKRLDHISLIVQLISYFHFFSTDCVMASQRNRQIGQIVRCGWKISCRPK